MVVALRWRGDTQRGKHRFRNASASGRAIGIHRHLRAVAKAQESAPVEWHEGGRDAHVSPTACPTAAQEVILLLTF